MEESAEERQKRLKLLAKERISRLVNGEAILPHSAPKYDVTYAKEAHLLAARLLDAGCVSLQIGFHSFELEEVDELRSDGQRTFLIKADGILLHGSLHWIGGLDNDRFYFSPSGELEGKVSFHSIYGSDAPSENNLYALLYYALFHARDCNWFSEYLTKQKSEILAAETAAQEIADRIRRESDRFRDILLRKYRQLVYIDEYESIEDGRFILELKRFAEKRLSDLDSDLVASSVYPIVLSWLDEGLDSGFELSFDTSMSPQEYERYCADLLSAAGWSSRLTPGSGDQGADIICEREGTRMVVQCKLYSSPVGNSAVQEVIAAKEFEFADKAVVVTNAEFTRSARELANVTGVLLLHHEQLQDLRPKTFDETHEG